MKIVADCLNGTRTGEVKAGEWTPPYMAFPPKGYTLDWYANAWDMPRFRQGFFMSLKVGAIATGVSILVGVPAALYLARTIVSPLQLLARAAQKVRQGRERDVEVPRLPERSDEIGQLARSVSDMTLALRQRIDAVDSFAADVAHEIKNPLASLRSAVESLPKVTDPDTRRELEKIITHDVRRIDRLVSEISDASRIDAEMSRATLERIDLADLVRAIIGSRENRAENANHLIDLKTRGFAATVLGVGARLERVVENLLDNAVSFSPPEAPIEVMIDNDGTCVTLMVCDSGPGIPEDSREKVFQRFHSVRPDEEAFGNHSGLGLAIARAIAEAHDGSLTAEGRPDGQPGACLRFRLPAAT